MQIRPRCVCYLLRYLIYRLVNSAVALHLLSSEQELDSNSVCNLKGVWSVIVQQEVEMKASPATLEFIPICWLAETPTVGEG